MGRLFAYMANDADRVRCAMHGARRLLVTRSEPAAPFDSWGIGFYQGGEVLLQRRPKAPVEPVDLYAAVRDLRTDCIVGHVRAGTVGRPKNDNTHPFRFRSWLFAHHGTVPSWEAISASVIADIPDFQQRNIRGQTDSEHLFHLILTQLMEAGKVDDTNLSTTALCDAMAAALRRIRALAGNDAMARAELAMAITNGRILVATRHGRPVHLVQVNGITDCPVCRDAPQFARTPKRIDHDHLRSVTLVADADAQAAAEAHAREIPDRTFVAVSNDLKVQEVPM